MSDLSPLRQPQKGNPWGLWPGVGAPSGGAAGERPGKVTLVNCEDTIAFNRYSAHQKRKELSDILKSSGLDKNASWGQGVQCCGSGV